MDYILFILIAVAVPIFGMLMINHIRNNYHCNNESRTDQSSGSLQDIAGNDLDSQIIVKVQNHFNLNFKDFDHPSWQVIAHGIAIKFMVSDTPHFVYYTLDGEWKSTLRRYTGEVLPEIISDQIRARFMFYKISCTEEVIFSDNEHPTYIVYMQKGNRHLEVIIENNEIIVMNEKKL